MGKQRVLADGDGAAEVTPDPKQRVLDLQNLLKGKQRVLANGDGAAAAVTPDPKKVFFGSTPVKQAYRQAERRS